MIHADTLFPETAFQMTLIILSFLALLKTICILLKFMKERILESCDRHQIHPIILLSHH